MWTGERRLENDGTAIEKVACFLYHTVLKPSFFDRPYVYLLYFIFFAKSGILQSESGWFRCVLSRVDLSIPNQYNVSTKRVHAFFWRFLCGLKDWIV